jgi:hypothetical protein
MRDEFFKYAKKLIERGDAFFLEFLEIKTFPTCVAHRFSNPIQVIFVQVK